MKKIVGFRNLSVYNYLEVERHFTYENIQGRLLNLVNLGKEIEIFLEKRE